MPGLQLNKQQTDPFWMAFGAAWQQHCLTSGQRVSDSIARETWRHEQLHSACGVYSLKQIPVHGKQYARIMARWEEITWSGIYWRMKSIGPDNMALVILIRETCEHFDLAEDYVCGIAKNALSLEELPDLETLQPWQLQKIVKILFAQGQRISASAHRHDPQPEESNIPF